METEVIALLLSVFSISVAALALGWNIYRDVILKPKLKVDFGIKKIVHQTFTEPLTKLIITATNFGPGRIKCSMIQFMNAPLWRRLLRKTEYAVILSDSENPMSRKLPATLEVGDQIDLILPYDKDCFLSSPCTHIGVSDFFRRVHWAPTKQVKKAREQYLKEFGKTLPNNSPQPTANSGGLVRSLESQTSKGSNK